MTTSKTTISLSEGRKRLFEIADEVQTLGRVYTLTADGRPKVVILSVEEYESIIETIEVLQDFPDLQAVDEEVTEALKTGEWKKWPKWEGVKKEIKRSAVGALQLAEPSKRKYGTHTPARTKSKKTAK